ncbi:hypothetical protein BpHYR1_031442 [Brachionus plicatilis]|uniref:Uncharacterized protein n=1 Tax=Brachionus plicatilis TaxID=10195 RepID=A0A3M7QMC6_BRAPC|nr:hypothetical protein BpHYR1_031442 [Brachionus plicatilis]
MHKTSSYVILVFTLAGTSKQFPSLQLFRFWAQFELSIRPFVLVQPKICKIVNSILINIKIISEI